MLYDCMAIQPGLQSTAAQCWLVLATPPRCKHPQVGYQLLAGAYRPRVRACMKCLHKLYQLICSETIKWQNFTVKKFLSATQEDENILP